MNGMYEELIDKLRKNNRMSGWTHIDRLIDEAAEAIEALQQENEQLRAQVARMKEALRKAREALKGVNVVRCPYCWGKETHSDKCEISKALAAIDKAIGGKEDV